MIGGPTASGKTALSVSLASHFSCHVLSADSRQFYRELNIGTAKPSNDELKEVPHHFIDNLSVTDEYDVGKYETEVLAKLKEIFEEDDIAILVGGTGLYLHAVCHGLDPFPKVKSTDRAHYNELYSRSGIEALQREIRVLDPTYSLVVDLNNPHRLIRALSFIKSTGQKFSDYRSQSKFERPFTPLYFATHMDREILYERINRRVDKMVLDGLEEEAREVFKYRSYNATNTVGYKELFAYFDGEMSKKMAVEKIKQHTRNYAKRQITWFKNQGEWVFIDPNDVAGATELIRGLINGHSTKTLFNASNKNISI